VDTWPESSRLPPGRARVDAGSGSRRPQGYDAGVDERDPSHAPEPASWRRLSRRTAYENAWITVWHDDVIRPDGEPGVYGIVHFANVAVGVVPIDDQDRVVLVGQHRYTLDRYSWEIPEGGSPRGEDPLDGARRELREETGYDATNWRELGRVHLSNSVSDEEAILYLATGLTSGEATPDGTEDLRVRHVAFDEALAMTVDGGITDAMSILGLQWVALARREPALAPGTATIDGSAGGEGDG
jgi:8-oxo-dGTP pyrophosphatase MutT (NUDIX family)